MNVITNIKVRGYHLDQHGHVNNVRYTEFLEEARYNLLDPHEDVLSSLKEQGIMLFIVNINISFAQPAFLGDLLKIETGISLIGRKSGIIHQEVLKNDLSKPILSADVTFVAMNADTGKALPMEGELLAGIQKIAGNERIRPQDERV